MLKGRELYKPIPSSVWILMFLLYIVDIHNFTSPSNCNWGSYKQVIDESEMNCLSTFPLFLFLSYICILLPCSFSFFFIMHLHAAICMTNHCHFLALIHPNQSNHVRLIHHEFYCLDILSLTRKFLLFLKQKRQVWRTVGEPASRHRQRNDMPGRLRHDLVGNVSFRSWQGGRSFLPKLVADQSWWLCPGRSLVSGYTAQYRC